MGNTYSEEEKKNIIKLWMLLKQSYYGREEQQACLKCKPLLQA